MSDHQIYPAEQFKLDLEDCARCGGVHENLEYNPFTRQTPMADYTVTHWAVCPTTNEPVFYAVRPIHCRE